MSWPRESMRHSLASRGIRTRAIPNPVAGPDWYDPGLYEGYKQSQREFVGSGLEHVNADDVVDEVLRFMKIVRGPSVRNRELFIGNISQFMEEYRIRTPDFTEFAQYDFDVDEDLIRRFYEAAKSDRDLVEVEEIHLIGSRVSGFYEPGSDLDVFIVVKDKPKLMEVFEGENNPRAKINAILYALWDDASITVRWSDEFNPLSVTDDFGKEMSLDVVPMSIDAPYHDVASLCIWRDPN